MFHGKTNTLDTSPIEIALPTKLTQFDKSTSSPSSGLLPTSAGLRQFPKAKISVDMIDTPTSNMIKEESEKSSQMVKRRTKNGIPMKRYAGDQCMEKIGSEDEGESSCASGLNFDKQSVASSALQSSIHLGLGGLGAEDSDAPIDDDSDDDNSIFTETDLA